MKTAMPFAMEGVKILEAYLLKQGAQNDVKLSLPAADYELLDALEKAGITNERDIYSVKVTGSKASYLPQFIPDSANLYELNILAGRLAAMSAWELDCFEGMVMMDALKTDYAPIMVERLINMTHSTADCQIALGAVVRNTIFIMFAKPTKITNGVANRVVADIHFVSSQNRLIVMEQHLVNLASKSIFHP